MLKPNKKDLIAEFNFKTLAPSLNELYSASTYQKKFDKKTRKMSVKKIKGQAKDADDYKKEYREHIESMEVFKGIEAINERVILVWTPHTNNRKKGHYDGINFCSNYKMIVDILVNQVKLFKNDDYRYIAQDILNHPELTDEEHYIKLSIYRTEPLWKHRLLHTVL